VTIHEKRINLFLSIFTKYGETDESILLSRQTKEYINCRLDCCNAVKHCIILIVLID